MFTPLRLQSGYIRIVDDGKDENGNAFDWRTLIPANDKSRPVTLTKTVGSQQQIVWQGFYAGAELQGELYSYTQEREFPVQCCLSVLSTTGAQPPNRSRATLPISENLSRRNTAAHHREDRGAGRHGCPQGWLMKMVDWRVFLDIDDNDEYAGQIQSSGSTRRYVPLLGMDCPNEWGTTLYLTMA